MRAVQYGAVKDALPNIPFATPENMETFYQYLKVILLLGLPFLIIWLAIEYGALLISVIRDAFNRMSPDDDDDYDETRD